MEVDGDRLDLLLVSAAAAAAAAVVVVPVGKPGRHVTKNSVKLVIKTSGA